MLWSAFPPQDQASGTSFSRTTSGNLLEEDSDRFGFSVHFWHFSRATEGSQNAEDPFVDSGNVLLPTVGAPGRSPRLSARPTFPAGFLKSTMQTCWLCPE